MNNDIYVLCKITGKEAIGGKSSYRVAFRSVEKLCLSARSCTDYIETLQRWLILKFIRITLVKLFQKMSPYLCSDTCERLAIFGYLFL